jgi:C4-type Zn-finger protein
VSQIRLVNEQPTTFTSVHTRCRVCGFRQEKVEVDKVHAHGLRLRLRVEGTSVGGSAGGAAGVHGAQMAALVVSSSLAAISIPECGFEIETNTHHGKYQSIAALLSEVAQNLEDQATASGCTIEEDDGGDAVVAGGQGDDETVQSVIHKLRRFAAGRAPFTFLVDDMSGNAFIFDLDAPAAPVVGMTREEYARTAQQNEMCAAMLEKAAADKEQAEQAVMLSKLV